jgi:hypothetical protein
MRRLITFRASAREERGATAVLMAILIPAVFLGVGALVINVGGWYVARGMDQNAADAAAVAVAKSCATTCDPAKAQAYANGVSNGKLAGQPMFVCGSAPGLTPCNGAVENGKACPVKPSGGAKYVTVMVSPEGGSMDTIDGDSQPIAACAQAVLGGPTSCDGCVALTISKCEWDVSTGNGTKFVTHQEGAGYSNNSPPSFVDTIEARRASSQFGSPNYYTANNITDPQSPKGSATIAGSETLLFTHGTDNSCGGGMNAPGQFGWVNTSGGCKANITGSTYGGDPGASPPSACLALFEDSRTNAKPIYLPVYSGTTGSGNNTSYTLKGFGAFVVTGWDITNFGGSGKTRPSRVGVADTSTGFPHNANQTYCGKSNFTASNSDICISGFFTKALVDSGPLSGGGGVDLGLTIAALNG